MDVRGDRFLTRFAGSDEFQSRLNHSGRARRDYRSRIPGDFSTQSSTVEPSSDSRMGPGATSQQTRMDSAYGAPNYGPNFNKQVEREDSLNNQYTSQSSDASSNIFNKYRQVTSRKQPSQSDGSSIANKYIRLAKESNPINVVELDRNLRERPLYHSAKSELEGLKTYGDKYRNARENLSDWNQPNPMEEVETPDFEAIYDKTKKDIDSIDI